jgi:hypothetical protein
VAALLTCLSVTGAAAPRMRYVVTERPLNIGLSGTGICVALDIQDQQGAWWWEPGAPGCTTRSTGPDLFRADAARVTSKPDGRVNATFRIGTHSTTQPFVEVEVEAANEEIRVVQPESDLHVPARWFPKLQVPFAAPRSAR